MRQAGTSADYRGLYASARDFVPPTAKELDGLEAELPERSEVPALVEMMVKVDGRWDLLKAIQKAGFKPPAGRPDVDPTAEALQLLELFRESSRLPEAKERGKEFLAAAEAAEDDADETGKCPAGVWHGPDPRSPEGSRISIPRHREELQGL